MEWDNEREHRKRATLLEALRGFLGDQGNAAEAARLAEAVLKVYVRTNPPRKEENDFIGLVVLGAHGSGGGKSTKAGNIRLNIGTLMEAVANGALGVFSAKDHPMTIPFAALLLCNSLWRTATVTISEMDAAVLYVMWVRKGVERTIAETGLLDLCNEHLSKYGRSPLSAQDLRRSLSGLEKLGTIKRSWKDKTTWWLREWVGRSYL
jgi:hypothetical protein